MRIPLSRGKAVTQVGARRALALCIGYSVGSALNKPGSRCHRCGDSYTAASGPAGNGWGGLYHHLAEHGDENKNSTVPQSTSLSHTKRVFVAETPRYSSKQQHFQRSFWCVGARVGLILTSFVVRAIRELLACARLRQADGTRGEIASPQPEFLRSVRFILPLFHRSSGAGLRFPEHASC